MKLLRLPTHYPATGEAFTLGELVDKNHFRIAYTVEDEVRPADEKVRGKTAIPAGRYKVTITQSPRFKRMLPRLQGVPMFEGILIHGGNTAENSEGCIIVGEKRTPNGVRVCSPALAAVMAYIEDAGGEVWLEIVDAV